MVLDGAGVVPRDKGEEPPPTKPFKGVDLSARPQSRFYGPDEG